MLKTLHLTLVISFILLSLTACDKTEPISYNAPKDPPPSLPPPVQPVPSNLPEIANLPDLPDHWTVKPASAMRVASYQVEKSGKTADFSLIPLFGESGSMEANVNRWRGQIGLPPSDRIETTSITHGSATFQIVDLKGPQGRTLAAIRKEGDTTWFYKLTGDSDLIEQEQAVFMEFLKSYSLPAR